jgi:hypothetical protein
MAKRKRIPLLATIPTLPSFPGIRAFVGSLFELFIGGILQADGILENDTIMGVP